MSISKKLLKVLGGTLLGATLSVSSGVFFLECQVKEQDGKVDINTVVDLEDMKQISIEEKGGQNGKI